MHRAAALLLIMLKDSYIFKPGSASARERLLAMMFLVATFAALLYLRLFNPATGASFYLRCPFNALTGLYCPGCGSTRAAHQLLHGHFAAALALNPLLVLLLPFLGYAFVSYALMGIRGRGLPRVFVPPPLIWLLFWMVLAFWILRNVPLYPFYLLAPHNV